MQKVTVPLKEARLTLWRESKPFITFASLVFALIVSIQGVDRFKEILGGDIRFSLDSVTNYTASNSTELFSKDIWQLSDAQIPFRGDLFGPYELKQKPAQIEEITGELKSAKPNRFFMIGFTQGTTTVALRFTSGMIEALRSENGIIYQPITETATHVYGVGQLRFELGPKRAVITLDGRELFVFPGDLRSTKITITTDCTANEVGRWFINSDASSDNLLHQIL